MQATVQKVTREPPYAHLSTAGPESDKTEGKPGHTTSDEGGRGRSLPSRSVNDDDGAAGLITKDEVGARDVGTGKGLQICPGSDIGELDRIRLPKRTSPRRTLAPELLPWTGAAAAPANLRTGDPSVGRDTVPDMPRIPPPRMRRHRFDDRLGGRLAFKDKRRSGEVVVEQ